MSEQEIARRQPFITKRSHSPWIRWMALAIPAISVLSWPLPLAAQTGPSGPTSGPIVWRQAKTPTLLAGFTRPAGSSEPEPLPQGPGSTDRNPQPLNVVQAAPDQNVFRLELQIPQAPPSAPAPPPALLPQEQILESLREQERYLLTYFFEDHFRVKALRVQIRSQEDLVAQKKALLPTLTLAGVVPPAVGVSPTIHVVEFKVKVEMPEIKLPPIPERVIVVQAPEIKLPPILDHVIVLPAPEKASIHQAAALLPVPSTNVVPAGFDASAKSSAAPTVPKIHENPDSSSNHQKRDEAPPVRIQAENPWWPLTLLHVGAVAAGLFLGLTIHLFVIWCLTRCLATKLAHLLRTELANATAGQMTGSVSSRVASESQPALPEALPDGVAFDLGPSYEDEMNQQKKDAQQKEEAVLRELFQKNVSLREQISQLETATT